MRSCTFAMEPRSSGASLEAGLSDLPKRAACVLLFGVSSQEVPKTAKNSVPAGLRALDGAITENQRGPVRAPHRGRTLLSRVSTRMCFWDWNSVATASY